MDRRKFLTKTIYAGGALTALGLGVPAVVTLVGPTLERESGPEWVRVGAIDGFPVGTTKGALIEVPRADWADSLRTRLLFVRRTEGGAVEIFSRSCTDLGCPVAWDPGSETFLCPCHGGIFDREGVPVAGPPSRPLYRYANRIRAGYLEVDVNSVPPVT